MFSPFKRATRPAPLGRGLMVLGRSLLLFGIGWAVLSSCPGGSGSLATRSVLIAAAAAGLWTFYTLRTRLPR